MKKTIGVALMAMLFGLSGTAMADSHDDGMKMGHGKDGMKGDMEMSDGMHGEKMMKHDKDGMKDDMKPMQMEKKHDMKGSMHEKSDEMHDGM